MEPKCNMPAIRREQPWEVLTVLSPFRPGSMAAPMFCMLALLALSSSAATGSVGHFRLWTVHGQLRSGQAHVKRKLEVEAPAQAW